MDNNSKSIEIAEISIDRLKVHPKNVRRNYENIDELAASIKENGVLQNLTVVPDADEEGIYFVVIGNRRLMAAREAGLETVPCRIASDMEEPEQALSMLTENMQRHNLSVSEESAGIQMCLADYGFSIEQVAERTGLSETTVRHRANIGKLDQKVLAEKEADSDFQLSLKDLAKLEKVGSIKERNRILSEARDSRDLAWKAQAYHDDEVRKKSLKKLVALAGKEEIPEAPEGTANEMYGSKWETVASYGLDGEIPQRLYGREDTRGLFYIVQYRSFKIIRKAKKEKKELTEAEKAQREARKRRKQVKAAYKEMHAQMGDFIRGIIQKRVEDIKDTSELMESLWGILMKKPTFISHGQVISTILGKEMHEASENERILGEKSAGSMPLHQQMMCTAYQACRDLELAGHSGTYAEGAGRMLKSLYECLALYGFSFVENGDEDYMDIMDGTSVLYDSESSQSEVTSQEESGSQDAAPAEGPDTAGDGRTAAA